MKCSLCDEVALRTVGRRGFCKSHRPQADFEAAKAKNESVSKRGMLDALHWETGRFSAEIEK